MVLNANPRQSETKGFAKNINTTPMPAEEQSAQSIIAHMNKDHKLALEDFLYVYGKVPITEEISNVRMQEFALDHMTITFEHSAIEFDVEKYIPIDPPLKDFSEARSRLVPMAKEAAAKRGFSHIRINEISKPRTILEYLIIVLVLLPFVAYVHRGILEFLPLPQSVLDFIGKDVVLVSVMIGASVCHAAEGYFLLRPKLNYYRVPTDYLVEWYFFCMLEGYGAVRRFDKLAYKRTH